jgi:hypothetical protein
MLLHPTSRLHTTVLPARQILLALRLQPVAMTPTMSGAIVPKFAAMARQPDGCMPPTQCSPG